MEQENLSENRAPVPTPPILPPPVPNDATGYLLVQVTTARGVIPLAGVSVVVRTAEDDGVRGTTVAVLVTDRNGNTERLPLPAPDKSESVQPGNPKPYANYAIEIEEENYFRQYYSGIPIFDGVTSIQRADLIPLPENGTSNSGTPNEQIFPERETGQL